MEFMSVLKDIAISRVMNEVVAGQTEQKSSVVDCQDYDGICFIVLLGAVTDTCVLTATAYENTASSTSSPTPTALTPAAGPVTAASSSDLMMVVDVYRPQQRYVFLDLTRTTANAVISGVIALRYRGRVRPVDATALLASALVAN